MLRTLNIIISFLSGLISAGALTLLLYLIALGFDKLEIYFFLSALPILFNPLYEEVTKYLSIKIWKIKTFNAFFFGLGWAGLEAFIRHLTRGNVTLINRLTPTLLRIATAMIIAYFIKRKRSVFGLITTIVLHAGYNFFLTSMR